MNRRQWYVKAQFWTIYFDDSAVADFSAYSHRVNQQTFDGMHGCRTKSLISLCGHRRGLCICNRQEAAWYIHESVCNIAAFYVHGHSKEKCHQTDKTLGAWAREDGNRRWYGNESLYSWESEKDYDTAAQWYSKPEGKRACASVSSGVSKSDEQRRTVWGDDGDDAGVVQLAELWRNACPGWSLGAGRAGSVYQSGTGGHGGDAARGWIWDGIRSCGYAACCAGCDCEKWQNVDEKLLEKICSAISQKMELQHIS